MRDGRLYDVIGSGLYERDLSVASSEFDQRGCLLCQIYPALNLNENLQKSVTLQYMK
jgi:hypothetical protein